jgi:hypothetical protein
MEEERLVAGDVFSYSHLVNACVRAGQPHQVRRGRLSVDQVSASGQPPLLLRPRWYHRVKLTAPS